MAQKQQTLYQLKAKQKHYIVIKAKFKQISLFQQQLIKSDLSSIKTQNLNIQPFNSRIQSPTLTQSLNSNEQQTINEIISENQQSQNNKKCIQTIKNKQIILRRHSNFITLLLQFSKAKTIKDNLRVYFQLVRISFNNHVSVQTQNEVPDDVKLQYNKQIKYFKDILVKYLDSLISIEISQVIIRRNSFPQIINQLVRLEFKNRIDQIKGFILKTLAREDILFSFSQGEQIIRLNQFIDKNESNDQWHQLTQFQGKSKFQARLLKFQNIVSFLDSCCRFLSIQSAMKDMQGQILNNIQQQLHQMFQSISQENLQQAQKSVLSDSYRLLKSKFQHLFIEFIQHYRMNQIQIELSNFSQVILSQDQKQIETQSSNQTFIVFSWTKSLQTLIQSSIFKQQLSVDNINLLVFWIKNLLSIAYKKVLNLNNLRNAIILNNSIQYIINTLINTSNENELEITQIEQMVQQFTAKFNNTIQAIDFSVGKSLLDIKTLQKLYQLNRYGDVVNRVDDLCELVEGIKQVSFYKFIMYQQVCLGPMFFILTLIIQSGFRKSFKQDIQLFYRKSYGNVIQTVFL